VPTAPQAPHPAEPSERLEPSGPDEAPVLPQRSADEDDMGWGDRDERAERDEWYRRERPPHHD
jgi:hypothetical protein